MPGRSPPSGTGTWPLAVQIRRHVGQAVSHADRARRTRSFRCRLSRSPATYAARVRRLSGGNSNGSSSISSQMALCIPCGSRRRRRQEVDHQHVNPLLEEADRLLHELAEDGRSAALVAQARRFPARRRPRRAGGGWRCGWPRAARAALGLPDEAGSAAGWRSGRLPNSAGSTRPTPPLQGQDVRGQAAQHVAPRGPSIQEGSSPAFRAAANPDGPRLVEMVERVRINAAPNREPAWLVPPPNIERGKNIRIYSSRKKY